MKKLFSLIFCAALILGCCLIIPLRADAATSGYYTYEVSGGKATIIVCDPSISGKITIPAKLGGYPVTAIGEQAFLWCENLTSVTIPNSVTTIGDYAFEKCTGLTAVTLPVKMTHVGELIFFDCDNLTEVTVPDGITNIERGMFSGCDNVEYNVYKNGKYLGNKTNPYAAFMGPKESSIRTVDIHPNTTVIAANAFNLCQDLITVTIPNKVITIGESAFSYCFGLASVTIPNSVTTIGDSAFYFCSRLSSVLIPDSVTVLGEGAFTACDSLTSVSIGNSVSAIGEEAFSGCTSLTLMTISDSVTYIGKSAFADCTGLTTVTIGNSVTIIDDYAFDGTSLTSIYIPKSVTTIGVGAFSNYVDLETVYYGGTHSQWQAIDVGDWNFDLTNATIYYNQFPDVKSGAWYYSAVEFAVEKGYFSGHGNGNFAPSDPITRQDFVLVLSRIAGADLTNYTGETAFADVKPNAYYAKAIQWATENGIIGGYNATTFGVGDKLTREQLVTIMYRYAKKLGVDVTVTTGWDQMSTYPDATAPNPNLREMVAWALEKGIISGKQVNGKTCIAPQASATRAETAKILLNISTNGLIPGI